MFGWINDAVESLVVTKFGIEKWHEIKSKADCKVADGGFIRHKYYTDQSTIDLVVAASDVLGIGVNDVLEVFGAYFMEFTRQAGYDNLLSCQGSNLRLWLSNLNALHDHLQDTLPRGRFPEFWCKDDEDAQFQGTILLNYFSERGSLFVPFVHGLVKEVARYHFDVEIAMDLLQTQGEDGCEYSCWRIATIDPKYMYKLSDKAATASRRKLSHSSSSIEDILHDVDVKDAAESSGCPFHQMQHIIKQHSITEENATHFWDRAANGRNRNRQVSFENKEGDNEVGVDVAKRQTDNEEKTSNNAISNIEGTNVVAPLQNGQHDDNKAFMSNANLMKIFPFHLIINEDFKIIQCGASMAKLVGSTQILGRNVSHCLEIKRPLLASWTWDAINKFDGQTYFFSSNFGTKKTRLKGHFVELSAQPKECMIFLAPDARNIEHLTNMGLTMSDLPSQTFQRESIFLGEHMYSGIKSAHKLDKLSRKLVYERNLSNSLLYSMLPVEVAKVLRAGKTFEPRSHDNVTLFFSDIVGFTDMCSEMTHWDTIDMLNRLYTVMDYLADYFGIYKLETIGDAYICCSGLPKENENHAEDVANFALAAVECVNLVKNPTTNKPLEVRIGVHSGACSSGVVGTKTPKYCVFGDTVNTTSRHETTGEAGKIHCSSATFEKLSHSEHYNCTPRGLVDMKGKGQMYTYWLDSPGEDNPALGSSKLNQLRQEVEEMLETKTWKKRRYFERRESGSTVQSNIFWSELSDELDETKHTIEHSIDNESGDYLKDETEDKKERLPITQLELDPLLSDFSNHSVIHNLLQDDLDQNIHRDPDMRQGTMKLSVSSTTIGTEAIGSFTNTNSELSRFHSRLSPPTPVPKPQNRPAKRDTTPSTKQDTHSKVSSSKSYRLQKSSGTPTKRSSNAANKIKYSEKKEHRNTPVSPKRNPEEIDAFFERMYYTKTMANKFRNKSNIENRKKRRFPLNLFKKKEKDNLSK